jgi:hypothetical protein
LSGRRWVGLFGRVGAAALVTAGCDALPGRSAAELPLDDVVAELIPAVERLSGMRANAAVRVERTAPEAVRRYIESRLEAYLPADQLEGMRQSYVMMGLLPDTLDLHSLLLELYGEQVAGYYDPQAKVLYVVETEAAGPIEPVLVHELVHAIQDQHVNLDSLIAQRGANDRQTAAQAAIEGHATLVMYAWLAESMAGDTVNPGLLPDPGEAIAGMFAGTDQFPVFRSAPRVIRETLLFPYVGGASFVRALWHADPAVRRPPFGVFLPQSTEQIMDPGARFIDGRDEPVEVRHGDVDGWAAVYENTLGAFETRIFVDEAMGGAGGGSEGWAGDRFTLYESSSSRVLVWTSVWDDDAAADLFVERTAAFFSTTGGVPEGSVRRMDVDGLAGVRITIGAEREQGPDPSVHCVSMEGVRVAC